MMNSRKKTVIAAALAAVLALTGCNSSDNDSADRKPYLGSGNTGSDTASTAIESKPIGSNSIENPNKSTESYTPAQSSQTSSGTGSKTNSGTKPRTDEHEFTFLGVNGIYVGDWKNNAPNGKGKFTVQDFIIDGEWKNGMVNGNSTWKFGNEHTYQGYFVDNDMKSGIRIITQDDGTVITSDGYFNEDGLLKKGTEKYEYKDGSEKLTDGVWSDDCSMWTGTSTKTYKDGIVDEIICQWSMKSKDNGRVYMSQGSFIRTNTDGSTIRYSGNWNSTGYIYQGILRIDNSDGSALIFDGKFENGEPYNGEWKALKSNGYLDSRGKVKNGKYGADWEKLIGQLIKGTGEGIGKNGTWGEKLAGFIIEEIGETMENHGALSSIN